ncbi:MAG: oligosaccharide flippase family protein [Thaumarchaeota archaeon]|nr:oligosaccharide flippase family protein [Nitrososphaerota archaeon]
MDIAKQSTSGSIALFVGNFASTLVLAVSGIVIARLLGPSGYGAYALALLLPNTLLNFVGLGVGAGITRYAARNIATGEESAARRMAFNGLVFVLGFGCGMTILTYFAMPWLSEVVLQRPELASVGQIATLAIVSQTLVQTITSALLGWNAMRSIGVMNLAQAVLKLALASALVLLGFGVEGAILGLVVSQVGAGVLGALTLYFLGVSLRGNVAFFLSDVKTMLRFGVVHFAGTMLQSFSFQYVTIVMASIASDTVIGFYTSGSNVLAAVSVASTAIAQSLFPAFAALEGVKADTSMAFRFALKYNGMIVAPIIFFLFGAAGPTVRFLYGQQYAPAAVYLALLALSNIPLLLGHGIVSNVFSGVGKVRQTFYFNLLNSGLQFLLAPLLGIWLGLGVPGLIYSILLSNLAGSIFSLYLAKSAMGATADPRMLLAVLVASMIPLSLMFPIQAVLLPSIQSEYLILIDFVTFAAVYLTAMPLVGVLQSDDIRVLRMATAGLGSVSKILEKVLAYESKLIARRPFRGAEQSKEPR